MNRPAEEGPAPVAATPMQAGEALGQRWPWVEPSVWTDRMLAALETGVKGDRWFSLSDKVESERNLRSAFAKVWRNGGSPGADGQRVESFERHLELELGKLRQELRSGTYTPLPTRRGYIPKPGSAEKRPLGIPAVRDRVVQGALRHVLEPIWEAEFAQHSYGFRPGRGCHDALRRVEGLLKEGYTWVVDADLKSYFDSIPHARLMERVRERVADGRVLAWLESYLRAGVLETMKGWQPTTQGTPQGAVISPLLANLYLNPLDHLLAERGYEMVRYADDFVILCATRGEAEQALARVRAWVHENGLALHPEKTRLVDATQRGGFEFLGYHFERGMKWPRQKSVQSLRAKVRAQTPRTDGRCLRAIIAALNPVLRGWWRYFRYGKANTFEKLDGYIRTRLRGIQRKRHRRRGCTTGQDRFRWPIRYFEQHGLFSLFETTVQFRRSRV